VTHPWYRRGSTGTLVLTVQVQPNAPRTEVVGPHGDALKIRVAAPPLENRANEKLIDFLAQVFDVPLRQVQVKSGEHARRKVVEIAGSRIDPEQALLKP